MDPERNAPGEAKKQLLEVEEMGVAYIPPEPISDEERERIKNEDQKEREKIKIMLAAEKDLPFFAHPNLPNLALSYHTKFNLKTESHYDFQLINALESLDNYFKQTHAEKKNGKIGKNLTG